MRTPSGPQRVAACGIAAMLMAIGLTPRAVATQQRGEMLYQAHCVACHTVQVHWRARRLVWNWSSLLHEVRRWQDNAALAWTERDIADVAHYLNQRYYRLGEAAPQLASGLASSAPAGPQPAACAESKRAQACEPAL